MHVMPSPRRKKIGERGNHVSGRAHLWTSVGAQDLSAPARQLTPQADERERFAFKTGTTILLSLLALGAERLDRLRPVGRHGRSQPIRPRRRPRAPRPRPLRARPRPRSRARAPSSRKSGLAIPPADAPQAVIDAINAGNRIRKKPYVYGGGHASFESKGYDCSGAVSYVLNAAGLLESPMPSGPLMKWGVPGKGSLDHGLLEPRPRIRGDRRPALGHLVDGLRRQRARAGARPSARRTGLRARTYTGF